jgi:CNT family concentrative nucleoside transporter
MPAMMQQFQGLIGLAAILLLAWAFSEDRANRPGWRWLGGALLLQLAIALIVVRVPAVWEAVGLANQGVATIEKATLVGSSYMFGYLGGAP